MFTLANDSRVSLTFLASVASASLSKSTPACGATAAVEAATRNNLLGVPTADGGGGEGGASVCRSVPCHCHNVGGNREPGVAAAAAPHSVRVDTLSRPSLSLLSTLYAWKTSFICCLHYMRGKPALFENLVTHDKWLSMLA